jgi:hypothetical protein
LKTSLKSESKNSQFPHLMNLTVFMKGNQLVVFTNSYLLYVA